MNVWAVGCRGGGSGGIESTEQSSELRLACNDKMTITVHSLTTMHALTQLFYIQYCLMIVKLS